MTATPEQIAMALGAVLTLSACGNLPKTPDPEPVTNTMSPSAKFTFEWQHGVNSFVVVTDAETGCQYLANGSPSYRTMIPRLGADGLPLCQAHLKGSPHG